MTVKVVVEGTAELADALARFEGRVRTAVVKAVNKGAVMIHKDAVVSVQHGEKTGRIYGNHQASAPGEAPASDTGELASGITFEIDQDGLGASVISRAPYSKALELGSERKTSASPTETEFGTIKVAPRPYLIPAFEKNRPAIQDLVVEAYHEAKE